MTVSHDAVPLALTAFDPSLGDPDQLPERPPASNTIDFLVEIWTVVKVNEGPAFLEDQVTAVSDCAFNRDYGQLWIFAARSAASGRIGTAVAPRRRS